MDAEANKNSVIEWTEISGADTAINLPDTELLGLSNSTLFDNERGGELTLNENNSFTGNGLGEIYVRP